MLERAIKFFRERWQLPILFLFFILLLENFLFLAINKFLHNDYTWAIAEPQLANTQWICTIEDADVLQELHLSFNSNGTTLTSKERALEFVKQGNKWKKVAYSNETGWSRIESGYRFAFKKQADILMITKETEFSGIVLEQWNCKRIG